MFARTRILLLATFTATGLALPRAALADVAACGVTATTVGDVVVNPPTGEDADFFVDSGGIPTVMFLLDSSGSMVNLPPDGAATSWGSFEDPAIRANGGYGCVNDFANSLVFHSSCGTTMYEGKPYHEGPANGWAEAKDENGKYCPYMVSGNQPPATDKPGFDPDFYPTFFNKDYVYLDVRSQISGGGWSYDGTNRSATSIAGFCNSYTGAKRTACNTCLTERGYFFTGSYSDFPSSLRTSCRNTDECRAINYGTCVKDGVEYSGTTKQGVCRAPDVYFTGNFLNFYPPKFLLARKVLKDVLASVRKMRLGLAVFNGSDGARIIEPLGPKCDKIGTPSSWDASRSSIKNAINNTSKVYFSGGTPLAEALLDIGQLFHTKSLPWFSSTYKDSNFDEGNNAGDKSFCWSCQASSVLLISDGAPSVDGKIPGSDIGPGMTEAVANTPGKYAGNTGYGIANIGSDCPAAICDSPAEQPDPNIPKGECLGQQSSGACNDKNDPIPSYLPKVAWYLRNMDFRDDNETGADGVKMTGKQSVSTYTIGFGTRGNASLILQHTAEAGGGLYNGGSGTDVVDAKALREAILRTLEDVNTRSISFGAASLSTLQASATQSVLIPRFEPSRSAHWNGHLYAFELYSEFSGGCYIPTTGDSGPENGDYDCDGFCTSVFLKDADGDFIQEDGTGAFKKNKNRSLAACGTGTSCPASKCSEPDPDADAKPKWDVGEKLASVDQDGNEKDATEYKSWRDRKIYTVTDSNGDGKFTSADTVIELAGDVSDSVANTLAPYLNLKGSSFCADLATRLALVGNPDGAKITTELASGTYTTCAKVVLQFAKGADVFNEKGVKPFPSTLGTRKYQLGDIFHSSPVEVWPPLPSDGWTCSAGLHPQCLSSLYETGVPNVSEDGNANAYDDYAKSKRYKHRDKFALVGANDGMLHAFTTGIWVVDDDDRTTPDERAFPYEGFHEDRVIGGKLPSSKAALLGQELWAFIPPDLLPKLRFLLDKTHHFYVDATPMVRDVWIDGGTPNGLGSATWKDGKKQKTEFHTIAIVGERRGGSKYFALDVTDAGGDLDGKPRFLWIYPQPDDPVSLQFGETYAEFVPKAPPIGPVRIDAGSAPCTNNRQEFLASTGETRCFEERWIAMLSGGFDPLMTRGRGVYMVDVGTGDAIWEFSQPPGAASTCQESSNPRCKLNYPVAATVGMMMWGTQAAFNDGSTAGNHNRFFDTATFGDTGGQLWVLRFSDPGILENGKVKNWFGARIFQHSKSTAAAGCGLNYCYGQPFFYITSNLPIARSKKFRVLAGTGDRFNLLDPNGGTCGPDNIRACIMKGCTVTLGQGASGAGARYGIEPLLGEQGYRMDHAASCTSVPTYTFEKTPPSGTSCETVTWKIDELTITCPSTVTCSGDVETTKRRLGITCTGADGSGHCDADAGSDSGLTIDIKGNHDNRNWFFSILVFEDTGPRAIFSDLAGAIEYDRARLSEDDLVSINEYDEDVADGGSVTKPLADPDGRGWKFYYDHGRPSSRTSTWTTTIRGETWDMYRTDERTASVSTVEAGCAFWNTMQTGISRDTSKDAVTGCPVIGRCKAGRAQVSYLYGANPGTGALCMRVGDELQREQKNETLVPPHIGKLVAYVNQGQVSFGLTTVRIPQGGANVALGEVQDITSLVSWMPVDESLEVCRHAPKDQPPADAVCREP